MWAGAAATDIGATSADCSSSTSSGNTKRLQSVNGTSCRRRCKSSSDVATMSASQLLRSSCSRPGRGFVRRHFDNQASATFGGTRITIPRPWFCNLR